MTIAETLLPEFDHEMGVTRRLLDRLPDGQFEVKPHPTSMSLGRLAEHVAEIVAWGQVTIEQDSFDGDSARPDGYQSPATRAAVLALFDRNVVVARQALQGRTDAELMAPWSLLVGGKPLFTMPKATVLRSFVFSHLIHHRGQLSVHMRMLGVAIPSIYGPSADEAA